jgi:putative serine protease PepD
MHPSDFGLTLGESGSWIRVQRVARSGAAALAGIRVGDIVLAIDGRPVETELDLIMAFSAGFPGRVFQLELLRGDRERHANLVTPR